MSALARHSEAPPARALTLVEELTAGGTEGEEIALALGVSEEAVVCELAWCVQLNRLAVAAALTALSVPPGSPRYLTARARFLAVLDAKTAPPGGSL